MLAAPYGVFALLASLVVESPSLDLFKALGWYAITVVLGLVVMIIIYIIIVTLYTKKKPSFFLRLEKGTNGYHTPSRTRHMYYNGKRIKLDPNDPGGEHE